MNQFKIIHSIVSNGYGFWYSIQIETNHFNGSEKVRFSSVNQTKPRAHICVCKYARIL